MTSGYTTHPLLAHSIADVWEITRFIVRVMAFMTFYRLCWRKLGDGGGAIHASSVFVSVMNSNCVASLPKGGYEWCLVLGGRG